MSAKGRVLLGVGLLALTAIALHQRAGGFGPDALVMDDQWVAALVEHASMRQLLELRAPTPIGFVLTLQTLARFLGSEAWVMQLVPFGLGLASIPLLGVVAYRLTGSVPAGLFAAALLAGSRSHAVYSLRVKHFAVEGFLVILLIALALSWLRRPRSPMLAALLLTAVVGLTMTFAATGAAIVIINGLLLHALLTRGTSEGEGEGEGEGDRDRDRGSRRGLLVGTLVFDAIALAWLALVAARPRGAALTTYWQDHFLPVDDLAAAWTFLTTRVTEMFTGALPPTLWWLAFAAPVGVALLLARRASRPYGVALLVFYAGLLAASALHLHPIGGRRTDVVTYPVTILAITGLLRVAGARHRLVAALAMSVVLIDAALFFPRPGVRYPASVARSAVDRANELVQDRDGLVVAPHATWAMACYGQWPVHLVRADTWTNGFYVEVHRPRTFVLEQSVDGVDYRRDPAIVRMQLDAALPHAPPCVWRLSLRNFPETDEWIDAAFTANGYRVAEPGSPVAGGPLVRFETERAQDGGPP